MLLNLNELKGLKIRATDGEIGSVDQFYFDDETIRYLVFNTGFGLKPFASMPFLNQAVTSSVTYETDGQRNK
jgi:hypothetical protein